MYPCKDAVFLWKYLAYGNCEAMLAPMYIERIPNRSSPPAVLIRESYREDGKVKKRTLANLSKLPDVLVEQIGATLRGNQGAAFPTTEISVLRSLPHGHIAAVAGMIKKIGLSSILSSRRTTKRDLATAMIIHQIVVAGPKSKLALAQSLREETAHHSIATVLGLENASEKSIYQAMDWLLGRQEAIEKALADRHLREGSLILYDVTSTYFEGRTCPLAKFGHNRDKKKGKLQIVIGLLCTTEGCPIAIEVFEGNTADPKTLSSQFAKVRDQFEIRNIVWVGDRGMLTEARIRKEVEGTPGLDWISALRAPAIRSLIEADRIDRSLFDVENLAEITSPDFPGERLVVCFNPLLAEERDRKRQELIAATKPLLDRIVRATSREKRPLRGKDAIGVRVGKTIDRYKVAKHFRLSIKDNSFSYEIDEEKISREAAQDGLYVLRTSLSEGDLPADRVVSCYKGLSKAERAFRTMKTTDLNVRPIHHRLEDRVRAHVFLCMLAYYVEWHMREALAHFLFKDEDPGIAEALRSNPVEKAKLSPSAKRKKQTKRNDDGQPVQDFGGVLATLSTICLNEMAIGPKKNRFMKMTSPTELQAKMFAALGVACTPQPM